MLQIGLQYHGGRGSGGGKRTGGAAPQTSVSSPVESNPELKLSAGQKITKVADEAFENTYRQTRRGMETFGVEDNLSVMPDFGERGYVSKQTLKGLQAEITSEQHHLDVDAKLGVLSLDKIRLRRAALNAMQRGLNKSYQQHKEYWNM